MATTAPAVADICRAARAAARRLGALDTATKDRALEAIADSLLARADEILEANARDLEAGREANLSPALMDRLALGRTPVREALRDLAREQLVEVYPRRGMFVSGVDVGDMAGLSEVRLVLEGTAARLAAERRNHIDVQETEALLEELARSADAQGERSLIELDQRLHRHVYRCTHNAFLAATLEEYYVLTLRIWYLALDRVERLDDAVSEHRELLEALRDGDANRAESVMHAHIRGFERAIRAVL